MTKETITIVKKQPFNENVNLFQNEDDKIKNETNTRNNENDDSVRIFYNARIQTINNDILKALHFKLLPITQNELNLYKWNVDHHIYSNDLLNKYANAYKTYLDLTNDTLLYQTNLQAIAEQYAPYYKTKTFLDNKPVSNRLYNAKNKKIYAYNPVWTSGTNRANDYFNPGLDCHWYFSNGIWHRKQWATRPDAINPTILKYYPQWAKDLMNYAIDQSKPPNLNPKDLDDESRQFFDKYNFYDKTKTQYSPYAKDRASNFKLFNGDVSANYSNYYLASLKRTGIRPQLKKESEEAYRLKQANARKEFFNNLKGCDDKIVYPDNKFLINKNKDEEIKKEEEPKKYYFYKRSAKELFGDLSAPTNTYTNAMPNHGYVRDNRSYFQLKTPYEKRMFLIRKGWVRDLHPEDPKWAEEFLATFKEKSEKEVSEMNKFQISQYYDEWRLYRRLKKEAEEKIDSANVFKRRK